MKKIINYYKHIKISSESKIGKNSIIGNNSYCFGKVMIGDNSYCGRYCTFENCTIGNYVSISSYVVINPIEHDYTNISTSPVLSTFKNTREVVVGNNVMIGINSIILGGITIGDGAVVGAGSVVTKDVPPYSIVAGNPAKVIKHRFDEEKIHRLEMINWDDDIDGVKKQIEQMN